MYVIDVSAVDGDSGTEERISFLWEEGRLSREHEDGHVSSAGFSSSLGRALEIDRVLDKAERRIVSMPKKALSED